MEGSALKFVQRKVRVAFKQEIINNYGKYVSIFQNFFSQKPIGFKICNL